MKQTAAAGSPFAHFCAEPGWVHGGCMNVDGFCCMRHAEGFADLVVPEVSLVLNVTA